MTCQRTWKTTFGYVQIDGETGTYLGVAGNIYNVRWLSSAQVEGCFYNPDAKKSGQFHWTFDGPEYDQLSTFTGTWSWDDGSPANPAQWNGSSGELNEAPTSETLVRVKRGSQLQAKNGCFKWVKDGNQPADRNAREQVAQQTLSACKHGGYILDGRRVSLTRLQDMVAKTRIVCGFESSDVTKSTHGRLLMKPSKLPMDVAVDLTRSGKKVVAVNAASAYQIGGGFFHGGRHALEEAICMQSTLFKSLKEAARPHVEIVERPDRTYNRHIPENGAILSPHVEIFRGGTYEGYPFWGEPVELCAIVSVAMPNCNKGVTDAPCDRPESDEDYRALLETKFIATLTAASSALTADSRVGAKVIVLPEVGCGAYRNNRKDVGDALGKVLLRYCFLNAFDEIHLVGSPEFTTAVMAAAGHSTAGTAAPQPTDGVSTELTTAVMAAAGRSTAGASAPQPTDAGGEGGRSLQVVEGQREQLLTAGGGGEDRANCCRRVAACRQPCSVL